MKKLHAILFLFLMLYNLVGYIANFHLVKKEWRNAMYQKLYNLVDDKTLVSFQFPKTAYDISEKEFVYQGHYYDVVKYETFGDSIKVHCFDDETETRLVSEFHSVLFDNTAQKKDFQDKAQGFFKLMVKEFLFEKDFALPAPPSVFEPFLTDFYYKNPLLFPPFLDFDSPPPQDILI
jgi:hypothetical protein